LYKIIGMKKYILSIAATLLVVADQLNAQVLIDTVSTGAGYANQKWYSLQNDEQGNAQPKDNWDIAFEITGFSASILANTQKPNLIVYKAPYTVAQFATIDTNGMAASWKKLYNSDTTWNIGTFNKGAVFANPNYLGWGLYDLNTHIVTGDSCYVIKTSATTFRKLKFDNLSGGVYNFTYSDISGANSQTIALNKSTYPNKNFAYFNLTTNTAIDREPLNSTWELTFTRHIAFLPPSNTPYPVTGVFSNKGIRVAQADNVVSPSYNNWTAHSFNSNISIIGGDWKFFDLANNAWKLVNDTVYFIKSKQNDVWKLRFTGFSGSSTGNYIFTKEKLSTVGLTENDGALAVSLSIYPNPSTQDEVTILYDVIKQLNTASLKIYDVTGKEVYATELFASEGFYQHIINTANYSKGIYMVNLYADGKVISEKLIKQ
jgi:hypothetical protein